MADSKPVLYEGMFLLTQQVVSNGLAAGLDVVKSMLDRAEAEVHALAKWDERKLAYPISGQKRGTFLLAVFEVSPRQIVNIERDCNLSEDVLRVMFLRADHYGETELAEAKALAQKTADEAKLRDAELTGTQESDGAAAAPASPAAAEPVEAGAQG